MAEWRATLFTASLQFSSLAQSCPTLCDLMDCSTPGFSVHHQLLELAQTHVHRVADAIQPSHPLSSPSPPVSTLSQHQSLFQWVSSSHQVAKVLELQFQHQSFQWELISFRIDRFDLLAVQGIAYTLRFSSVQLLTRVRLFATPWTAACQASLSITNSRSSLRLMSIESVMPSNHLILYHPLLLPSIFPSIGGLFQWVSSSHWVAQVLELRDLWLNIFCMRIKIELYLPSFPPPCNWVGKGWRK